jgi:hypothetical protein
MSPEESLAQPFAPKIVKKLPKKIVSQDKQMVKFEVKVVGYPKPEVKWSKQGEEIVQSDEFQIENTDDGTSILIINEIYPDDTGEIKCEAFNSVGVSETVTRFVVEGNEMGDNMKKKFTSNDYDNCFQYPKICSKHTSSYTFIKSPLNVFIVSFMCFIIP